MLMQKSVDFNIELNAKDGLGLTAFHTACCLGNTRIVEMMIDKAERFKIELTAKTKRGETGFDIAKTNGKTEVVNLIKRKLPSIAF